MCRKREGRKKVGRKEKERRRCGAVREGGGCLKREGEVEVVERNFKKRSITRTAGDKLSSKKCNFGIAPACMPFEPFIVWDSLGAVPLIIFIADIESCDV